MNYYERHIGDWIKDTVALDMIEDGAYNRLTDQYYQTEKPLPLDIREVYRLARANKPAERKAVDYVLSKYFERTEEGYRQKRADEEIQRYAVKQNKARASADARWSKVRGGSEGNANASPEHDANGMRTHSERNAHQTPDTRHQEGIPEPKGSSSAGKLPPCQGKAIVDLYHEILPELPSVVVLDSKPRQTALRKVWTWVLTSTKADHSRRATTSDEALAWFRSYFERARENDFLMGRTPRTGPHANWRCDLDFLLTDRGMKHVIEKT
jgi:uncharacterized protein YdaU (DUF1376 family)